MVVATNVSSWCGNLVYSWSKVESSARMRIGLSSATFLLEPEQRHASK